MRNTTGKLTQRHRVRTCSRIQREVRLRFDQALNRQLVTFAARVDGDRVRVRGHLAIDIKDVSTVPAHDGDRGRSGDVAMKREVVCF